MKKAIIVTATQGLGLVLQKASEQFSIASQTYAIGIPGVGETKAFSLLESQFNADLSDAEEQFDFIVWNTGVFLHKPFADTTDFEIDTLIDLHYRIPLKVIRSLHKKQKKSYHLIAVSSCSSWRMRDFEAIYCGLCAAKATFVRNLAKELFHLNPNSKVTLINPGGLRTAFFYEESTPDLSGFLDQDEMAKFIWRFALDQKKPYEEIQYLRSKSSQDNNPKPIIEFGVNCAETI